MAASEYMYIVLKGPQVILFFIVSCFVEVRGSRVCASATADFVGVLEQREQFYALVARLSYGCTSWVLWTMSRLVILYC